jgi:hypothetical protein
MTISNLVSFWSEYCQGRRKVDNWGGRYSYIHVLHHLFPLKAIVFTVCEHEYMNISPPIIDFPAPLSIVLYQFQVEVNAA